MHRLACAGIVIWRTIGRTCARATCTGAMGASLVACAAGVAEDAADIAKQANGAADPANDGTPGIGAGHGSHEGAPGFVPAPHPPLPEMVSLGGPVMHAPRVVPVFFRDDPLQIELTSFLHVIGTTDYWRGSTAEYGVGPMQAAPAVVLD